MSARMSYIIIVAVLATAAMAFDPALGERPIALIR
jgi:hypothetical protein